jgi:hypothetical protein
MYERFDRPYFQQLLDACPERIGKIHSSTDVIAIYDCAPGSRISIGAGR